MPVELLPHAFFTLKDGSKMRYARFEPSGMPRGTVLIIPGRREFIEKKFSELGQPLLDKGWRLVILEPRGQGLSHRFLTGNNRQRDHIDDFDTHLNDLRAFYKEVVQPDITPPLVAHGHSLGAHMVLRWLAEDHPAASSAFLTAPMLALSAMPAHLVAHGMSWFSARILGHAHEYAPLQRDFGTEDCVFADNVLTHDPARFPIIEDYFKKFPDLTVGGVTWGWLLAALKSMHQMHAVHYLGRVDIPVLALVGGEDKVTPAKDIAPYLNLVPRVQTQTITAARHDVLNESADILTEAWQRINLFLDAYLIP